MKTINYGDDQAVLAESKEKLKKNEESVVMAGKNFGINLNEQKTTVVRLSNGGVNISLEGEYIEQLETFKYLESRLKWNGS